MKKTVITAVLLTLILCGCGNRHSLELKDSLRMVLSGEPSVLNPVLSTDTSSSSVEGMIFEGLIDVDRNLSYKPLLAYSWEPANYGRTWYFYLKRNIYWHDGIPFTADDVVFTFKKILDPATNTVRRSNYVINGRQIKVRKINKFTVRFDLPEVFAPFELAMTMPIIPKHIYQNEDINRSEFNRKPIGTGPFKFSEWRSGSHIILERNNNYHRKPALVEKIIFRIIPDINTQLAALRKGEVDMASIPPKDFIKFKNNTNLDTYTYDQLLYTYIGLNQVNEHFQNIKVRQAMTYAINKEQLCKTLFKGLAKPAHCPCSPISWAYTDEIKKYDFNPLKAKAILLTCGYKMNNGVLEKNGKPFKFTLLISQGSRDGQRAAVILQQYLKQVGILMDIQVMEWSALLKIVNEPKDPKNFDAVLISWSLGIDPDAQSIWHSSEYPKGFNFVKYNNSEADKLCTQGRRITNKNKRQKIYQELWKIIAEDQPYIFLWYPKSITAVSKRVDGYDKNPGPLGIIEDITKVFITDK